MLHKGNDASNLYDEEVGEDEIEFSDDEAEREWKRQRSGAGKAGDKRKRRSESVSSARTGSLRRDQVTEEGVTELSYDDNEYQPDESKNFAHLKSYEDGIPDQNTDIPSSSHKHNPPVASIGSKRDERRRGRGRGRGHPIRQHPERGRSIGIPSAFGKPNVSMAQTQNTYANNEYNPALAGHMPMPSTLAMNMGMSRSMAMVPSAYQGPLFWPGMPPQVANSGQYGFAPSNQIPLNQGVPNSLTMPVQTTAFGLGTPSPGAYINPRFAMMNMTQNAYGNNVSQEPGANPPDSTGPFQ
jgi:H/ACA ribonucleoprotein complex non-core subunit NAF1